MNVVESDPLRVNPLHNFDKGARGCDDWTVSCLPSSLRVELSASGKSGSVRPISEASQTTSTKTCWRCAPAIPLAFRWRRPCGIDNRHAVAEALGLLDVMGGHHDGALFGAQFFDERVDFEAHLRIEAGVGHREKSSAGR